MRDFKELNLIETLRKWAPSENIPYWLSMDVVDALEKAYARIQQMESILQDHLIQYN